MCWLRRVAKFKVDLTGLRQQYDKVKRTHAQQVSDSPWTF
jgi:hypothetical protein